MLCELPGGGAIIQYEPYLNRQNRGNSSFAPNGEVSNNIVRLSASGTLVWRATCDPPPWDLRPVATGFQPGKAQYDPVTNLPLGPTFDWLSFDSPPACGERAWRLNTRYLNLAGEELSSSRTDELVVIEPLDAVTDEQMFTGSWDWFFSIDIDSGIARPISSHRW